MKASVKKTVRRTVFSERVAETFDAEHAATSEKEVFTKGNVLHSDQKRHADAWLKEEIIKKNE